MNIYIKILIAIIIISLIICVCFIPLIYYKYIKKKNEIWGKPFIGDLKDEQH